MKTFDDIASTLLFILLIILVTMFGLAVQGCANKATMADYDVNCTQCAVKIKFTKEIDDYSLAGIKN